MIVVTDRHWDQLCLAIDRPDMVVDERFETREKRTMHSAALFDEITPWTLAHEKYEVMRLLGEASVPCSAVLDTYDLYRDPHLVERGFIKKVEHPELGEAPLLGFPTRMSDSAVEITRAPYLGEHSEDVLREDLDIGGDELASLREAGILG